MSSQKICFHIEIRRKIIINIALDKVLFLNQKVSIFFLFLNENICCGYSLEAPRRGASNEYPQHMFSRAQDGIQLTTVQCFIAQSPFMSIDMT